MADASSMIYIAAEHIETLIDEGFIKPDLFGVRSKVSAVLSELKNIDRILLNVAANNEQIRSV